MELLTLVGKKTEYKNDRINWNKQKSNYAFENF